MKLRARVLSVSLAILMMVQTAVPVTAAGEENAAGGQVVMVDENGNQQVYDAEDIANGALGDNIVVQEPQPGQDSSVDSSDSDLDSSFSQEGDSSDEEIDPGFTIGASEEDGLDWEENQPQEDPDEQPSKVTDPVVYWNPGQGYEVDPSLLPQEEQEEEPAPSLPEEELPEEVLPPEDGSGTQGGENQGGEDNLPGEDDSAPGEGDLPGEDDSQPGEGDLPGEDDSAPGEGDLPGEDDSTPGEGDLPGEDDSTPGEGDLPGEDNAPGEGDTTGDAQKPEEPELDQSPDQEESQPEAGTPEEETAGLIPTVHAAETVQRPAADQEKGLWDGIGDWFAGIGNWFMDCFRSIGGFLSGLFVHAEENNRVPQGDDSNDGFSPLAPVQSFETALERAGEAADALGVEMSEITIYQMNPVTLAKEEYLPVDAGGAALAPWQGRSGEDASLYFRVEGGDLTLQNVALAEGEIWAGNGGRVILEEGVTAPSGFVLDFSGEEAPYLQLGESFGAHSTYPLELTGLDGAGKILLAWSQGGDEAALSQYLSCFTLPGEMAEDWVVQAMPCQEFGGYALYAVLNSTDIYWNPGEGFESAQGEVPQGSDDNDGRTPQSPVKSFETAVERAQETAAAMELQPEEITVQQMNTVELSGGESLALDGGSVLLKAWEGRTDESGILFYINDATLTLQNVSLQARQEETEGLVWVYDGKLVLEENVSNSGSFVLDFFSTQRDKDWPGALADSGEKQGEPLIELGDGFTPDEAGYLVRMKEETALNQLELIQGPGLSEEKLEEYLGSFDISGDSIHQWRLEIWEDGQRAGALEDTDEKNAAGQQQSSMGEEDPSPVRFAIPVSMLSTQSSVKVNAQDLVPGQSTPAQGEHTSSLYAVRASGSPVYWNPGPAMTIDGQTYQAGNDNNDGTNPRVPVRTLARSITAATQNNTDTIICMQPVDLTDPLAKEYLGYQDGTFELHGPDLGDKVLTIRNWSTRQMPVVYVNEGVLSVKRINLVSSGDTRPDDQALYTGTAMLEVSDGGQVTLGERVTVQGGYIQLDFESSAAVNPNKTPPNPILVSSGTADAWLFCSGINRASFWQDTVVAKATAEYIAACGGEKQAGEAVAKQIHLERANSVLTIDGGMSEVGWELLQGDGTRAPLEALRLSVTSVLTDGIFIDPVRGDDSYDGYSCEYPVKTLDAARRQLEKRRADVLATRAQLKADGVSLEERNRYYPVTKYFYICSPLTVADTQAWDWSGLQGAVDEEGSPLTVQMTLHLEPGLDDDQKPLHTAATSLLTVPAGGKLTLGQGVWFTVPVDKLPTNTAYNLVQVTGTGSLTLTGNAQFTGTKDSTEVFYSKHSWIYLNGTNATQRAALEMGANWTGKISGVGRGVYSYNYADTTMLNGEISDNASSQNGVGVSLNNRSTFTMDGENAVIQRNQGRGYGTAINASNNSSVMLKKGKILENYSINYEGVVLYASSGNTVTLGAEGQEDELLLIQGNTVEITGSSDIEGGLFYCTGTFTMYSGKIDGNQLIKKAYNSSSSFCRGVILYAPDIHIYGGKITNNKIQKESSSSTGYFYGLINVNYVSSNSKEYCIKNLEISNNSVENFSSSSTESAAINVKNYAYSNGNYRKQTLTIQGCIIKDNVGIGGITKDDSYGAGPSIYPKVLLNDIEISGNSGYSGISGGIKYAQNVRLYDNRVSYHLLNSVSGVFSDLRLENNQCSTLISKSSVGSAKLTLTETVPGRTVIQNNTATSGTLVSLPTSIDAFYLDCAGEWSGNTGKDGAPLTRIFSIPDTSNGARTTLYLMKGSFPSGLPLVELYTDGSSYVGSPKLYLDPQEVKSLDGNPLTLKLQSSKAELYLLRQCQEGGTTFHLDLSDPDRWGVGSPVVRPANLASVTFPVQVVSDMSDPTGVSTTERTVDYTPALQDVTPSAPCFTVEHQPPRTTLGALPNSTNPDLVNLGLLGEGVYLDGVEGQDSADGHTPDTAVKSWGRAVELLGQYSAGPDDEDGFQPTIYVCNTVTLDGDQTLTLPQGSVDTSRYDAYEEAQGRTPEEVTVKGYTPFRGTLFRVEGGTTTLRDILVDGQYAEGRVSTLGNCRIFEAVDSAGLNILDGARLWNSYDAVAALRGGATAVVEQTLNREATQEDWQVQSWGAFDLAEGSSLTLRGDAVVTTPNYVSTLYRNLSLIVSNGGAVRMEGKSKIWKKNSTYVIELMGSKENTVHLTDSAKVDDSNTTIYDKSSDKSAIRIDGNVEVKSSSLVSKSGGKDFSLTVAGSCKLGLSTFLYLTGGSSAHCQVTIGEKEEDAPQLSLSNHLIYFYSSSSPGVVDLTVGGKSTITNTGSSYVLYFYMSSSNSCQTNIILKENSKIDFSSSSSYFIYANVNKTSYIENASVGVTMQDNAILRTGYFMRCNQQPKQVTLTMENSSQCLLSYAGINGSFPDYVSSTYLDRLEMRDSALIGPAGNVQSNTNPTMLAKEVVLEGSPTIRHHTRWGDPTAALNRGLSIATDKLTLSGQATVEGGIRLGGVFDDQAANPIVLTQAPTGREFRLQLGEVYLGKDVVVGDGTGIPDASLFLDNFKKVKSQGAVEEKALIASPATKSIRLEGSTDVYLSTNGDDQNDGTTPQTAVRTFARAKAILQGADGGGYGEGSSIIIPDSCQIAPGDEVWSFDQGGNLTNTVTGQTWKPKVSRQKNNTYSAPLIRVTDLGTRSSPVTFQNITIDGGGNEVKFTSPNTSSDSSTHRNMNHTLIRAERSEVLLGQNAVIENGILDKNWNGSYQRYQRSLGYSQYLGHTVIDGAVFQNFQVNISLTQLSYYPTGIADTTYGPPGLISVAGGELEFRSGQVTGNSATLYMNATTSNVNGSFRNFSLITVSTNNSIKSGDPVQPGKLVMSGGEISGNHLTSSTTNSSYLENLSIIGIRGANATMEMTGGRIEDNVIETKFFQRTKEQMSGTITVGEAAGSTPTSSEELPTFYMRGGRITGNTAVAGSAVTATRSGRVVLEGGTISGNRHPDYTVGDGQWESWMSPVVIYESAGVWNGQKWDKLTLAGGGCVLEDPIFLGKGATISVSREIKQTDRVYEVYPETVALGATIVQPDGDKMVSAAPFLLNFNIHALGRAADIGGRTQTVETGTIPMPENALILLFKPVFVDGDTGVDPQMIHMETGQIVMPDGQTENDRGLDPAKPVKTFDAAKLIGQMEVVTQQHTWEEHKKHKDYFIIYAIGPMYNELYQGSFQLTDTASVDPPNTDAANMTFQLTTPAHICRYTNFQIHLGNGLHAGGDAEGEQWYNYDNVFYLNKPGNVTFSNMTVAGRREIENNTRVGEALVRVGNGVTLTVEGGSRFVRNKASGSRPGNDGIPVALEGRGGALRVDAGGRMVLESITVSEVEATYGSAIYLERGQTAEGAQLPAGQLLLSGKLTVEGSIYLAGDKGADAHLQADKDFSTNGDALSLELEVSYKDRLVAEYIDGTRFVPALQQIFGLPDSVTAIYEVVISGQNDNEMRLGIKSTYYLDPVSGADTQSGTTPETALKTLDGLYTQLDKESTNLDGVLVYIMNPIQITDTVELYNASYVENALLYYFSRYKHGATEVDLDFQVFFKRYSQPKNDQGGIPAGYNKPTYLGELFNVNGTGELRLNGVTLDGHSRMVEDDERGLTSAAVEAQAPLVVVQPGGLLECDSINLTINGKDCTVGSTTFTNNLNAKRKDTVLEGTATDSSAGIIEGSSAGIEILSSGTGTQEKRGKVILQRSNFTNLQLGKVDGVGIVGGTDVYQNGELTVGVNTFFEGSVFLEGNGKSGDSPEAIAAQRTSRWLGVNKWGVPVQTAFSLLVRDPYNGRRMVKYPLYTDEDGTIVDQPIFAEDIANYHLHEDVTRYYSLVEQKFQPDPGNILDPAGAQILFLTAPAAIYLDPVGGDDAEGRGFHPKEPVKTLEKAFTQMKTSSSKTLYIMNPVPITQFTEINHEFFQEGETVITLPNSWNIEVRRYVKPDVASTNQNYNVESYQGVLFDVQSGGELVFSGDVQLNGHRNEYKTEHTPKEQVVTNGVKSTAPLVMVEDSGVLRVEEGAKLLDNNNTETLSGGQTRTEGGAVHIKEGGTLQMAGGALENNSATPIGMNGLDGSTAVTADAGGVYSDGGSLVMEQNPAGIPENQGITLAGGSYITMEMLLKEKKDAQGGSKSGEEQQEDAQEGIRYHVDILDPSPGRDVVNYNGYTGVDVEYDRYILGPTVPKELFLVESADAPNVLELQDWKLLEVSVPEEVFLAAHEYKKGLNRVSRVDTDGSTYATPEYTITNNGLYEARVTVTGFPLTEMQTGMDAIQLAETPAQLSGNTPLLYLALDKSSQTEADGNRFAALKETSLKSVQGTTSADGAEAELGVLKPGEHGNFVFTGQANAAFMERYLDSNFPGSSLNTAQQRKDYMRQKDTAGNATLTGARARFKLQYRIELASPRRQDGKTS